MHPARCERRPIRRQTRSKIAWRAASRTCPALEQSSDRSWRDALAQKLDELNASPRQRAGRGFEAAVVSMLLGRRDEALCCLRAAVEEGSWAFVMQYYPVFDALRDEPEFIRLLEAVGLDISW